MFGSGSEGWGIVLCGCREWPSEVVGASSGAVRGFRAFYPYGFVCEEGGDAFEVGGHDCVGEGEIGCGVSSSRTFRGSLDIPVVFCFEEGIGCFDQASQAVVASPLRAFVRVALPMLYRL